MKTKAVIPGNPVQTVAPKRWTMMVYLAGDNDLDEFGSLDLLEMKKVGSNDALNVIAQFDRAGREGTTKRFYLQKGTPLAQDAVADLGETNTGDPLQLVDFIKWGVTAYPAEHYAVVLWNHGAGWTDEIVFENARAGRLNVTRRGNVMRRAAGRAISSVSASALRRISRKSLRRSLFNTTINQASQRRAILLDDNARDFLDNVEMKRVLTEAKKAIGRKIDILGLDACLMNMAEVAHQVCGSVDFAVGSQEVEPGDGWPYDTILKELAKNPALPPRELTKLIVQKYLASYRASENITQSALDLSQSRALAAALDHLARTLIPQLGDAAARAAIRTARDQVREYDTPDYIDLFDFCSLLKGELPHTAIAECCDAVLAGTRKLVVASGFKGTQVTNSNGVSIYFPTRRISPLYAKLDFVKATQWDEFLKAFLMATRRRLS